MSTEHQLSGTNSSLSDSGVSKQGDRVYWVGIGASAGGLEALTDMVKKLPREESNITYLVAQHLSPRHQSMMVQLIGKESTLPVKEVRHGVVPQPGTIYITPPNSDLYIKDGRLQLREPPSPHSPKPSVDFFFTTLAEELGDHAIGVILSGTGSDGSHGVRAIRAGGGLTIAQTIETAKYDGMPHSAIETGCVDIVLPASKIGAEIASLIRSPHKVHLLQETDEKKMVMQELMHLLKGRTKVDFNNYKSGTLLRRLNRRMTACGVADLDAYLEYVRTEPPELDMLFRDMMITVTQFFRDKEAFNGLQVQIAELLEIKKEEGSIRVWVPGCATGEEAYSIVMFFAEAAGGLDKLKQNYSFQLFATDIDMDALAFARKGIYAETTLESVDKDLKDRYFKHRENAYEISKSVREMVVFSKHNVFDDPPFLRLDLITCRNLLIYFNNRLQNIVMDLFHYALNPLGVLFLGKSEALGESANLFQATNSAAKLYKRKLITSGELPRTARLSFQSRPRLEPIAKSTNKKATHEFPDAIVGALSPDSLLIDENMDVLRIYGDVQAYTQLSAGDANTNLASLVRKEFRQELRALVYKVMREDISQSILPKNIDINGIAHKIHIIIRPLQLKATSERLLLISFEKIRKIEESEERKESIGGTDPILAELEQELTSTREHLQTVVEELETSNEELQSTNEEMQSTNEELQSSNEELETANEELQSTNEELLTVNDELQTKSAELTSTNEDLENIKENIDIPMMVVDEKLAITRYNQCAADIFLLGRDSLGDILTTVGTRIDIPELRQNVQKVMSSGVEFSRQLSENGKYYFERNLPFRNALGEVKGAVLMYADNTQEQEVLLQLQESQERYDLALNGSNAGIWDWNIRTGEMHWSVLFQNMVGVSGADFSPTIEEFKARIHDEDRDDILAILNAHLTRGFDFDVEFRMRKTDNSYMWVHARGQALWDAQHAPTRMTGSLYDITERHMAQARLSSSNESLERFAYVCSHDLSEPARLVENFSSILQLQYREKLDDDGKEFLDVIEQSSIRMREMISGILSYSQLESKNLVLDDVDVNVELGRVVGNLKLSIEETAATVSFQNMPVVRADKMQLFQVFQNLISNALKFCVDKKPIVDVAVEERPDEWIFSVRDNGIGMESKHSSKIFQVFQQLNGGGRFKGCGIGLSTCQKIVQKHGGKIWVESVLGEGSSFIFTLPKTPRYGDPHERRA